MAGFGFSPQDIFQGITVAKRICEAHFVRERRAGMLRNLSSARWRRELPELVGKCDLGDHAVHSMLRPQFMQDLLTSCFSRW
jgi:hypothetical protein